MQWYMAMPFVLVYSVLIVLDEEMSDAWWDGILDGEMVGGGGMAGVMMDEYESLC